MKKRRLNRKNITVPVICMTDAAQKAAEYDMYSRKKPPAIIPRPMPMSQAVNIDELAVPRRSLRATFMNMLRKAGNIWPFPRPMRAADKIGRAHV